MPLQVIEHVISGQHIRGYPYSIRHRQEDILKLAVKQYVPSNNELAPNAVTILALHGLGFPKVNLTSFYIEASIRFITAAQAQRSRAEH